MAVHADIPSIDVTFLDYPDHVLNEDGARGVGEIGLAGIAAAIASAAYHATGVRVRKLPITLTERRPLVLVSSHPQPPAMVRSAEVQLTRGD